MARASSLGSPGSYGTSSLASNARTLLEGLRDAPSEVPSSLQLLRELHLVVVHEGLVDDDEERDAEGERLEDGPAPAWEMTREAPRIASSRLGRKSKWSTAKPGRDRAPREGR